MALSLICACGARFEVEDTLAGQDVSCPECQQSLKAPALKQASLRTSDLALASTVLALVGAFTVIGTIAAVVLGSLGLVKINRNRERISGAGFAMFGIAAGTIFTVLTLLALSSNELFGLGGKLRSNMLADRVDTTGELFYKDAAAGFSITRPSREWGVSTVDTLQDPYVQILQGSNATKADLLFVQTRRDICVDIHSRQRPVRDIDALLDEVMGELAPAGKNEFGRNEDGLSIRITKVVPAASSKKLDVGEGLEVREKDMKITCTGKTFKMRVRVYYNGDRLFIVRAYGPVTHFDRGEQDLKKLLDSFTILDGR